MKLSMIVLLLLMGIVTAFAVQNSGDITVRFLHVSRTTSIPVVIVASFAVGVLGGWLAGLPGFFRRRSEAAAAARRIRELEAEVGGLKKSVEGMTPPPKGNAQ
jgi:uncharacterized integral membrane protein